MLHIELNELGYTDLIGTAFNCLALNFVPVVERVPNIK